MTAFKIQFSREKKGLTCIPCQFWIHHLVLWKSDLMKPWNGVGAIFSDDDWLVIFAVECCEIISQLEIDELGMRAVRVPGVVTVDAQNVVILGL